jgi:hypothetical protein
MLQKQFFTIFSRVFDTVLGFRPAMLSFVGHSADFILRSVDDSSFRWLFGILRASFSRRPCFSSAVRCSLLLVQSTTPAFVGCSAFFVPRSAFSLGFFDYFQSALPGLDICTFQTTVST